MTATWSLPGFEVEQLLGFGATGEVWRARERVSGDLVALKRLRDGADPAAVAALRREAVLLRGLDTPYVVRLRAVLGEGPETVLVLDHAGGGSLAALLSRRGRLEPGEVVTVAAPLAQALAAAHARGLVHGDVSPANVLFTSDGMPLLSDLGVSRVAGQRLATVDGTAEYVDPAVARGGEPDPSSDVWALGAVCHHLLAGTPPHDGGSVAEVLDAAAVGARAPLGLLAPHAPRSLVAVVEGALAADPTQRPDAAALGEALQRATPAAPVRLTGAPPVAAPVPDARATHEVPRPVPPPGPPERRRRRPPLAVLAAVAVVLALLAGGLAWALRGPAPDQAALPPLPPGPPAVASTGTPGATPAGTLEAGPAAASSVGPAGTTGAGPAAAPGATPTETPGAGPAAAPPVGPAATSEGGPAAAPADVPGPAAPPATALAARVPPDWRQVLTGLDRERERAYAAGDGAVLAGVYAAGSTAGATDAAALAALTADGRRATGVRHEVRSVEQRAWGGDTATLRYVDVLGPHTVVDAAGAPLQRRPGRGEAAYDVVLVRVGGGWRIAQLAPA